MRKKTTGMIAAVCLCLLGNPLAAADIEEGKRLAEDVCANCHDIGPDGEFKQLPPSFAAIARYRAPRDIWARVAFPSVHSGMPRMNLIWGRDKIDDVVAYIVSLDKTTD